MFAISMPMSNGDLFEKPWELIDGLREVIKITIAFVSPSRPLSAELITKPIKSPNQSAAMPLRDFQITEIHVKRRKDKKNNLISTQWLVVSLFLFWNLNRYKISNLISALGRKDIRKQKQTWEANARATQMRLGCIKFEIFDLLILSVHLFVRFFFLFSF